jgi:HlyD family secretion protein
MMLRVLLIRAATGTLIAAGGVAYSLSKGELATAPRLGNDLRYASLERGDVIQNVTAAGTLEAVDTVDVSSQLSGQIASLKADYNSVVRSDEALAGLDSGRGQGCT